MTERVTLITGASAGIGTELARIFASNGHRLALVARRANRLAALAAEIAAAGGSAPIVIPCDLERPDCGDRIAAALAAAGVEVEFVVNNAGFGLFGSAIELDREQQLGMIAVNIRAMTDLSLRFSDQLIRHRGGILNVGSIAGFLPKAQNDLTTGAYAELETRLSPRVTAASSPAAGIARVSSINANAAAIGWR